MKDYWSSVSEDGKLYQMGPMSHRLYLLNYMRDLGVKSFLDVGCGTAPLYQLVTESDENQGWDFTYKGVDPSIEMIASSKKNFPYGNFEVEDAINLQEKDSSWDALVYMHSFDYVYDYMQALKEAHRVSKKYVIIILWQQLQYGDWHEHKLNNSINGSEPYDWSYARLQHFAWDQLQKELHEIGFKILLKKDDVEINQEGRHNTMIVLEKI